MDELHQDRLPAILVVQLLRESLDIGFREPSLRDSLGNEPFIASLQTNGNPNCPRQRIGAMAADSQTGPFSGDRQGFGSVLNQVIG